MGKGRTRSGIRLYREITMAARIKTFTQMVDRKGKMIVIIVCNFPREQAVVQPGQGRKKSTSSARKWRWLQSSLPLSLRVKRCYSRSVHYMILPVTLIYQEPQVHNNRQIEHYNFSTTSEQVNKIIAKC